MSREIICASKKHEKISKTDSPIIFSLKRERISDRLIGIERWKSQLPEGRRPSPGGREKGIGGLLIQARILGGGMFFRFFAERRRDRERDGGRDDLVAGDEEKNGRRDGQERNRDHSLLEGGVGENPGPKTREPGNLPG